MQSTTDKRDQLISWGIDAITGEWVSANDANKYGLYFCSCDGKHPVCLRLPSGAPNVRVHRAHFAHKPQIAPDGSKMFVVCRGGGESQRHLDAKHRLRELLGQYFTVLGKCCECGEVVKEDFKDGTVKIEIKSDDQNYRYDAVYTSNDGRQIALEVFHTHRTRLEKIEGTRVAGMQIAEFKVSDIEDLQPGVPNELHNQCLDPQIKCLDVSACVARKLEIQKLAAQAEEERMKQWKEQIAERAAAVAKAEALRIKLEEERAVAAAAAAEVERIKLQNSLDIKEHKWQQALAIAREKIDKKKKTRYHKRPASARVTDNTTTINGNTTNYLDHVSQSGVPMFTPWGYPHLFRCYHGVPRLQACDECGQGRTWETFTLPYIRARRAQGFYPF